MTGDPQLAVALAALAAGVILGGLLTWLCS